MTHITQICSKINLYTLPILDIVYQKLYLIARETTWSPNIFTIINICLNVILLYIIFLNKSSCFSLVCIVLIMILHFFLDNFDGCLARLHHKTSKFGAILDNISDISYYLIFWLYILYIGFYKKIGTNILLLIAIILIISLIDITFRFKSFAKTIEYMFGGFFAINRLKIPHIKKKQIPPWRDTFYMLFICFILPIIILCKYHIKL